MKPIICFTGAGSVLGQKIDRAAWEEACGNLGYPISGAKNCNILVASRDDTTKARDAKGRGATVMTYDEFAGELRMNGCQRIGNFDLRSIDGYGYESMVERKERERREVAERAEREIKEKLRRDREEREAFDRLADENPMWGSF